VVEVAVEGMKAVVMDHPTVEAFSKAFEKQGGPIDGIVGFTFFARFKVTLDYQAKTMTFVPNGYNPPDVMQAMMAAIMANPSDVKVLSPASQWGMIATKEAKDEDPGVTIKDVLPGGPAAKAGLKAGDRLLTLDGRWTDSIPDLYTAAGFTKPGKEVKIKIKRDGKEMELKVTPLSGL